MTDLINTDTCWMGANPRSQEMESVKPEGSTNFYIYNSIYFLLFGVQSSFIILLYICFEVTILLNKEKLKTFGVTESYDGSLFIWDHDDTVRQSPVLLKVQLQHIWKGIRIKNYVSFLNTADRKHF